MSAHHAITRLVAVAVAAASLSVPAVAVDFANDVLPILEERCLGCHDRYTLEGGVGLETFYHATLPTDGGDSLFVPGRPDESVIYRAVTASDPEQRMPLDEEPLSDEQIATLRRWIEAGAVWPDDGWRPPVHWSLVPPERPAVPAPPSAMLAGRDANEIDHFIAMRLHENGLGFNAEAEPARLIRRVYLDLTGLPPSLVEVDAFVADPTFERYKTVVDSLLASPAYGEKWAIAWLDLARYADSEGYQRDAPRSMWPYREWVIDALNQDLPFDQFTVEQLAGDLLPGATESQIVATAFHRNAPTNLEAGTDPREDRYKVIVDRVNTTATIWLGLTVGCAQCHNHKYDPISAKEYYELYAFFDRTPMETRQLGDKMGMSGLEPIGPTLQVMRTAADNASIGHATDQYERTRRKIESAIREACSEVVDRRPEASKAVPDGVLEILESDEPMSLKQCRTVFSKLLGGKDARLKRQLDQAQVMLERLERLRQNSVRVMREDDEMRATYIAKRGDFLNPGQQVYPATPAALHPMDDSLPGDRLGLARWLVDPANPLVGRTCINRLWIQLFGQGLVTTPDDFGSQGAVPTHPRLLDWLAVAFIEDDRWSMKQAVRRVVLSATYRQSIQVRADAAEIDPRNQLLWRHPGHRLPAEIIRDSALSISGLLSGATGGGTVRPFQPATFWRRTAGAGEELYLPSAGADAYRRGVYTLWRRNAHYPSFANFDAPDRTACTVQRDVSNTPLQALTLLNDPAYVEIAKAFGTRIANEGGDTLDQRLQWAFRTTLARRPSEAEAAVLRSAYEAVLDRGGSATEAHVEIATILLNLHETIHRS